MLVVGSIPTARRKNPITSCSAPWAEVKCFLMKKKNIQSQKVHVQRRKLRLGSAKLHFGRYGLKALETGLVRPKQLEVVRRVFLHAFRRKCSTWVRLNFIISRVKQSVGARMGSGKGKNVYFVAKVLPGQVVFEFSAPRHRNLATLYSCLRAVASKLSVKFALLKRRHLL
jgi:large subunit ribosomal protein L16